MPEIAAMFGTDRFVYTIEDSKKGRAQAVVEVTVTYLQPPTAAINTVGGLTPSAGVVTLTPSYAVAAVVVDANPPSGSGLSVSKVELFADGKKVGEFLTPSSLVTFNWVPITAGTHYLQAKVIDSGGGYNFSPMIKVIKQSPINDSAPKALISHVDGKDREKLKSNWNQKPDPAAQYEIPVVNGIFPVDGIADDSDSDTGDEMPASGNLPASEVRYQFALYSMDATLMGEVSPVAAATVGTEPSTLGSFGDLDLTRFPDGTYELELSVWDLDAVSTDRTRIVLRNRLKVGQFTFSQEDVVVPGVGLPLSVIRTYDSFNPRSADFGYGWTYALNDLNVELDEYRRDVSDEFEEDSTFSMREGGGRDVTLTLPDGRRTTFTYDLRQVYYEYGEGALAYYEAIWLPEPGVTATLTTLHPGQPRYRDKDNIPQDGWPGDNTLNVALSGLGPIDPYWQEGDLRLPMEHYDFPGFKLTLEDGTIYEITRGEGEVHAVLTEEGEGFYVEAYEKPRLSQIIQPDGTIITIDKDKITTLRPGANEPVSAVVFDRDRFGRIKAVYDPLSLDADGNKTGPPVVEYFYDDNGNLFQVSRLTQKDDPATIGNEQKKEVTSFYYNTQDPRLAHYIERIVDSRGIEVGRTTYYSDPSEPGNYGKIKSITDADGFTTEFEHEGVPLSGLSGDAVGAERVTDEWENETIHEFDARGNVVVSINPKGEVTVRGYDADNNQQLWERKRAADVGHTLIAQADYSFTYHDAEKSKIASKTATLQKVIAGAVQAGQGIATVSEFDDHGRLVGSADAMGTYTRNTYDSAGNLFSTAIYESKAIFVASGPALQTLVVNNYHPTGHQFQGLLEWTKDAGNNYTYYDYYIGNEATFAGAFGQVKGVQRYDGDDTGTLLSKVVYTYDAVGNTLTEAHAKDDVNDLVVTRSFYDAKNRLTKTIDPEDTRPEADAGTRTVYNSLGKVDRSIDRLGNPTTYVYNGKGEVIKTIYPDDSITLNTTIYAYPVPGGQPAPDGQGRAVITTQRHQSVDVVYGSRTVYDEGGRAVRTERLKNIEIEIESLGGAFASRFVRADNPLSYTETTYDNAGRVQSVFDSLTEATTSYEYDGYGRQYKTTKWTPISATKQDRTITEVTAYDANGNVLSTSMTVAHFNRAIPPVQQGATETISTPSFSYDKLNRRYLTTFTHVENTTTFTTYKRTLFDALGRAEQEIDQEGVATKFNYDGAGRLTSVIKAYKVYNPATLNAASPTVTDANPADKAETKYVYDLAGNMVQQTDANQSLLAPANQKHTIFTYDGLGRQRSRTLPMGGDPETATYNDLGQLSERVDFKGQKTKFKYNSLGQLAYKFFLESGQTVPANSVAYEYDGLGRVTKIYERSGAKADVGFASISNGGSGSGFGERMLASLARVPKQTAGGTMVIPMLGLIWWLVPRRKWTELISAMSEAWRKQWGEAADSGRKLRWRIVGSLATLRANPRSIRLWLPSYAWRFATVLTLFFYLASDPAFEPLWTAKAACTLPANPTIPDERVTEVAYDDQGRLTQVNAPEGVINYEYDAVSGRQTRMCSKNSEVAYGYDLAGRLETVQALRRNNQTVTEDPSVYEYTSVGSRKSVTLPNHTVTSYGYDDLNRLRTLEHKASDTTVLASYTYGLYPTGRRQSATEVLLNTDDSTTTTRSLTWNYDKQYRLKSETVGTSVTSYQYDKVGNRLQKSVVNGGTPGETINYTLYNENDQLLTEVSSVSGTTSYGYDDNGSLTSKTVGTSPAITYAYNLANKLKSVTAGGTTTSYLYNDAGIRVQSSEQGGPTTRYLVDANNHTGYAQVLEELATVGGTPSRSFVIGDDVLGQCGTTASDPAWLLYDGHGSTRHLVKSSKDVKSQYNYDAYGISLSPLPTDPETSTSLLYCGEQYDSTLGMYNLRARFYNPSNGRFNARDSFMGNNEDPQSLHKYAYAHCDPVNAIDPSGYMSYIEELVVIAIIAIIAVELILNYAVFTRWAKSTPGNTYVGDILNEYFSSTSRERLWVMGPDDRYTRIVERWGPVRQRIEQAKNDLRANLGTWQTTHTSSPGFLPGMNLNGDPNAWDGSPLYNGILVQSPPGTGPGTAGANLMLWRLTGFQSDTLHTSAIGSFWLFITVDSVDASRNKATIRIWMANAMSRESFGSFAPPALLFGSAQATQWMWWNWTEELSL